MDQEPVRESSEPTDGKPKLFQNINGVIAGLTGLVVAVGGLLAAYNGLKPEKKATEDDLPGLYTGDKRDGTSTVKIEFDGSNWILTEGRNPPYTYAEIVTSDERLVKAYDKTTGYYLRWPVKGGLAEESQDDDDYDPYADVMPSE